ncbi:MAG: chorismate mutase [Clostridiaceae bacterium]|nr:chorismate mutase [Clostridiaceae bacterium]
MVVRAIRGAITADQNSREEIIAKTKQLLKDMIELNEVDVSNVISIFFTCTKDLDAVFPAVAARELGLTNIPLMCANEMDVPGSLPKCIRILLSFNTDKSLDEIKHVYLGEAKKLRPDLVK